MTKSELFFDRYIFPYLDDIIDWKVVMWLDKKSILALTNIGLIKEQEATDRDVDSFIVCGEYKIHFHRYFYYISKIQKGNDILYEYSDKKASDKKPRMKPLLLY